MAYGKDFCKMFSSKHDMSVETVISLKQWLPAEDLHKNWQSIFTMHREKGLKYPIHHMGGVINS